MQKSKCNRLTKRAKFKANKPQYFQGDSLFIVHGGDLKPRRAYHTEEAARRFMMAYDPSNQSVHPVEMIKVSARDVANGVA